MATQTSRDRDPRRERCPDKGYCHGRTIVAGSPPCDEGSCYRVRNAGPLSGVFPDDRWPAHLTTDQRVSP